MAGSGSDSEISRFACCREPRRRTTGPGTSRRKRRLGIFIPIRPLDQTLATPLHFPLSPSSCPMNSGLLWHGEQWIRLRDLSVYLLPGTTRRSVARGRRGEASPWSETTRKRKICLLESHRRRWLEGGEAVGRPHMRRQQWPRPTAHARHCSFSFLPRSDFPREK